MADISKEWVHIRLDKEPGGTESDIELRASSPAAAMDGMARLVEHIAEGCGVTVEHVLSVLAVVLLAPDRESIEEGSV